ncbi:hypothetical protein E2C01_006059 [Portunus trituberculatus]|uniref:Uncharacterized protein n=1 Tax=Portunus trituberculatus TaxID=210409 RepID=A0A5B7CU55_PORTR|nr:hypothetical protein [Portunus trituberculatus]
MGPRRMGTEGVQDVFTLQHASQRTRKWEETHTEEEVVVVVVVVVVWRARSEAGSDEGRGRTPTCASCFFFVSQTRFPVHPHAVLHAHPRPHTPCRPAGTSLTATGAMGGGMGAAAAGNARDVFSQFISTIDDANLAAIRKNRRPGTTLPEEAPTVNIGHLQGPGCLG